MVRAESNSEAAMRSAMNSGRVPPGAIYYPQKGGGGLIIERKSQINQDCLKNESDGIDPLGGHPTLNFSFTTECSKVFANLTSGNIGIRFAVVINDEIITAPRINGVITGGSGYIEGGFTKAEVKALAKDLNRTITYHKRK